MSQQHGVPTNMWGVWQDSKASINKYFSLIAERYFPNDTPRRAAFVGLLEQAFLPNLAIAVQVRDPAMYTRIELREMTARQPVSQQFAMVGQDVASFVQRVEQNICNLMQMGKTPREQKYHLDLIIDWLAQTIEKPVPWLYAVDEAGKIDRFNNPVPHIETIIDAASRGYRGFRMEGLVRGFDYREYDHVAASADQYRFMRLASVEALQYAARTLNTHMQYGPQHNGMGLDYEAMLASGGCNFVALCCPQGRVEGIVTLQDGVLYEATGAHGALLNKRHMEMVIGYVTRNGFQVSQQVAHHGMVVTQQGLVSYLDLFDMHRAQVVQVQGDLNLQGMREGIPTHGLAMYLRDVDVTGNLIVTGSDIKGLMNVRAGQILAVDCPKLNDIDASVAAQWLLTDRQPGTKPGSLRIRMGAKRLSAIYEVAVYDPAERCVVEVMSGQAFATLGGIDTQAIEAWMHRHAAKAAGGRPQR